jgi:AbiU2
VGADRQREIEDGLYDKWQEWIERIYDETITLFAYRSFYRGIAEMTQTNDEIPASSFFDAQGAWYATTQVIAVRRQTDTDRRAVSLARLLTNMKANPTVMTRARFAAMFIDDTDSEIRREISVHHANDQYDRFAGTGNDTISPERYQQDLDRFLKLATPIKQYVDRLVAHNDQRELTSLPTYEDLNAAIDLLAEFLNKYMVHLKATGVPDADPVHQADWRAAFRVAWLSE